MLSKAEPLLWKVINSREQVRRVLLGSEKKRGDRRLLRDKEREHRERERERDANSEGKEERRDNLNWNAAKYVGNYISALINAPRYAAVGILCVWCTLETHTDQPARIDSQARGLFSWSCNTHSTFSSFRVLLFPLVPGLSTIFQSKKLNPRTSYETLH